MKTYIGDSVYCDFDGWMFTLTTENGLPHDPGNIIYLEMPEMTRLLEYVGRTIKESARDQLNGEAKDGGL